jgi:demethylmenaquinone methyltransferase/2-methoxy-6-polyprenyl-1,4-benzoquinol methylase
VTTKKSDQHFFGFEPVADAAEKTSRVRDVFKSVAGDYDLMNDLMSGGLHRIWKRRLIAQIRPRAGMACLDVAGGTGDIAFLLHNATKDKDGHSQITVSDINPAMLEVGKQRATDRGLLNKLQWVEGNAESLPFKDNSFDLYTIAFGLRNVAQIDKALADAYRILKPGGRFFCLEFSKPVTSVLRKAYDLYSFNIIPFLGEKVAQDRASYQYLVESIRQFPDQKTLVKKLQNAGFKQCTYHNMSAGIVAIHCGVKI